MFKKVPGYVWLLPVIVVAGWIRLAPDLEDLIAYGDLWLVVLPIFGTVAIVAAVLIPSSIATRNAMAKFTGANPEGLSVLASVESAQMSLVAVSTAHPGESPITAWRGFERRVVVQATAEELVLWRYSRKSESKFVCFARIPTKSVIGVIAKRTGLGAALAFAIDTVDGPLEFQLSAMGKSGMGRASVALAEEQVNAIRGGLNL